MADRKFSGILKGFDSLHLVGEKNELRAKLELKGFLTLNPNVGQELVQFWSESELLGESKTLDVSGIATLSLPPLSVGTHSFKLTLKEDSRYKVHPATLTVAVISSEQPILISDIDHTILDAGYIEAFLKKNIRLKPLKDAPESLQELSKKYQILYITSREEFLTNKTRRWLSLRGFPLGPIFFWDLLGKDVPIHHAKYKMELVKNLKKRFPNIVVGIGDRAGDAIAYLENGIRAYIMPSGKQEFPPETVFISGWKEIISLLNEDPPAIFRPNE